MEGALLSYSEGSQEVFQKEAEGARTEKKFFSEEAPAAPQEEVLDGDVDLSLVSLRRNIQSGSLQLLYGDILVGDWGLASDAGMMQGADLYSLSEDKTTLTLHTPMGIQ